MPAPPAEGPVAERATDDQGARQPSSQLDRNLVVEAGAGSGKTSFLVDRLVELVRSGQVELRQVAAVTFTDRAASELRSRVRDQLDELARQSADDEERGRLRQALEQLDGAAIGTLHAFARRVLTSHALDARLPPGFSVMDEVSSGIDFDRRWEAYVGQLLSNDDLARSIVLLRSFGAKLDHLRQLARQFEDNWDLVKDQVGEAGPPRPVGNRYRLGELRRRADELRRRPCRDEGDRLRRRIVAVAGYLEQAAGADDEAELVERLHALSKGEETFQGEKLSLKVSNLGRKEKWDDVNQVRQEVGALATELEDLLDEVKDDCLHHLASSLRRFVLDGADQRRRRGELCFHDLLVLCRQLLRDPERGPEVTNELHQTYRRLLLDEAQDTDPIQFELAVRIAAGSGSQLPWDQLEVAPGSLFVVGDPTQSIYRFRRADLKAFADAFRYLQRHGEKVELRYNFRSVAPTVEWVNRTFSHLFGPQDAGDGPSAMVATRTDPPPVGPPVCALGAQPRTDGAKAAERRRCEAEDVAQAVARVVAEGWSVHDDGGWRPARLGDVAVLLPTRTSLGELEHAFEQVGVPFRTQASSLPYLSQPVRDLLLVLRAADDPSDRLAVASALRTPLMGCGDDDLFRFARQRRGSWDLLADQPPSVPADDPVRQGLEYLRQLHQARYWLAPCELVQKVALDRRAFELAFGRARPGDVWRRLRFVIDQARAWTEATGGNLRQYLRWLYSQVTEGTRVDEPVLAEGDDDAVAVMTVHAAKGLEFPVVVLAGMTTELPRLSGVQAVFPPGGTPAYRLTAKVQTRSFAEVEPDEKAQDEAEQARLLYVACTRARDHLVVCLHRCQSSNRTWAGVLAGSLGEAVGELPDASGPPAGWQPPGRPSPPPPPPYADWQAQRQAALERASRPRAVAASALATPGRGGDDAGLGELSRSWDLAPWPDGGHGAAVGRAVHGALRAVELATGRGLEGAVAAQCQAEAVPQDQAASVLSLARAALECPSVRRAAAPPHWRELYVCAPVGDRLLEGYVDLLYRAEEGLVVVDYKTADTSDPARLAELASHYRHQGASYALATSLATGEPVARVTFAFLTPAGALELHLEDLEAAVGEVRDLLAAGADLKGAPRPDDPGSGAPQGPAGAPGDLQVLPGLHHEGDDRRPLGADPPVP
jgi:ATP-dependent helicase/nuclease subunit A